ncbi:hypothetical protein GE061_012288 [Apolygus lucorum]|uniref:RNase H type-1 domain-containing protein n=1 Tax=Apolygus lucorum TaxID=248454 RepID=A0A8S9XS33_APOLU|nr:hypothetical protein GE061_012288 [Apolygus lucorum]
MKDEPNPLHESTSKEEEHWPARAANPSLETISQKYPVDSWIQVFTDGSSDRDQRRTDAGFNTPGLFEGSVQLSLSSINFDAVVRAINEAATILLNLSRNPARVVFLVDTQAAINSLCSIHVPDEYQVLQARKALGSLMKEGWQVVLQWVASHCGVQGNEAAFALPKRGNEMPPTKDPISHNQAMVEAWKKVEKLRWIDPVMHL